MCLSFLYLCECDVLPDKVILLVSFHPVYAYPWLLEKVTRYSCHRLIHHEYLITAAHKCFSEADLIFEEALVAVGALYIRVL